MPVQRLSIIVLVLLLGNGVSLLQAQEKPAEGEMPRRVGEGVSRPEKISGGPPVYTELARKAGVTGTIIIEAIIDENGGVTNANVLKSLPMGLDQAALEAVESWKFKPALFEGRPVKVYYTLTVNFQIDRSGGYGPVFRKLLEKDPELAGHLGAKRYEDALALLDRQAKEKPDDSEIQLARVYVLLEQKRFDVAWQEALAYRGPEHYEVFLRVTLAALERVQKDRLLNAKARAEVIEVGLLASVQAMGVSEKPLEATAFRSLLLIERAKLTSDPKEQRELMDEASRLQRMALAEQQRQQHP